MEEYHQIVSITNLSVQEKVGQLVMAQAFGRFRTGSSPEYQALLGLLENYYLGGFKIYHGHALGTLTLTSHLDSHSRIPLFFASDLEMGLGQQIVDAPRFPPMAALGAANDSNLAFQSGYWIAKEALHLGINLLFSPLLDLHSANERYFGLRCIGSQPDDVAEIGAHYIKGILKAGALSTAKYFPGNGEQQFLKDGSTINHQSRDTLKQREWIPFNKAIDAGVDAVMISHGAFLKLDSTAWKSDASSIPAVLSRQIVNEILRKELGFNGLIVTDALNLPFLRKYSMREIACYAITAGADLLVALTTPQDAIEAIKGIYDALDKGLVNEAQIDESVNRILAAKGRIRRTRLDYQPLHLASATCGSEEALTTIETIAKKSITLLKMPENGFPVNQRPVSFLGLLLGSSQVVEQIRPDPWQPWHSFAPIPDITVQWTSIDSSQAEFKIPAVPDEYHAVILVPLQLNPETRRCLETILEQLNLTGKRVILAMPIAPQEAKKFAPDAWASLWMPDFYQASRHALLSIITGNIQPVGQLC